MKDDDNRSALDKLNELDGLIDHALASYTPHRRGRAGAAEYLPRSRREQP